VRDNVTGLTWEVKKDKDGVAHYDNPHDADNTYTWYDPSDPYPGTPGEGTDTGDFLDALNSAQFGGFDDWRLPTIKELRSLVDYRQYDPAINRGFFPNTVSPHYWSSTTFAHDTNGALSVEFHLGGDFWFSKSDGGYVRAVRGGQSGSFDHYVEPLGKCGGLTPCYSTIQGAMNAAADGDTIQVGIGTYYEAPTRSTTGTVTISGGWNSTFTGQTGTIEMYAPQATGGGGVKVQPNVKVIPRP